MLNNESLELNIAISRKKSHLKIFDKETKDLESEQKIRGKNWGKQDWWFDVTNKIKDWESL